MCYFIKLIKEYSKGEQFMNFKATNRLFITILICMGILLGGCSRQEAVQETRALFSWKDSEVLEGRTQLFATMKELKLNTLYQEFSKELQEENILDFLGEAAKEKIDVYLLAGSPEWALQEEGESMCRQVENILEINRAAGENQGVKGILFDVEPYLLKEWDKQGSQEIMDKFVKGMKVAYQRAQDSGLEVILCIPYFYDDLGVSKQLETLIESGCDSIAIMNYYQGKEYEHIKREAALSAEFGKNLISIYELQAPIKYGLKDKNSYYEEGIKAVEENFAALQAAFHGKDISIAFHEYEALKEVAGRE